MSCLRGGVQAQKFCFSDRESQPCAYGAGIRSVLALSAGTHAGYVSPCLKLLLALSEEVWQLIWKQILAHRKGIIPDIFQRRLILETLFLISVAY